MAKAITAVTHVGLDAHKDSIHVAMMLPGATSPVEWRTPTDAAAMRRLTRRLTREARGEIAACYEAGPLGFALQRRLIAAGIPCQVIAPSLIPAKPGERIKTDRRDAKKLAELFRAGLLTEVVPPDEDAERVRDLCRCREDARQDLTRCRHRLGKMLLRRGVIYRDGKQWTKRHQDWLRRQRFDAPVDRIVFDDYLLAIERAEERLAALEDHLERVAAEPRYREQVGRLRCFRGASTVVAMTFLAELHDLRRFASAPELMAYLGLVPSESSSGAATQRGGITKTGNTHVRRILVEAAWCYRHRPASGKALRRRQRGQPTAAIAIAERAQARLHRTYWKLVLRGKPHNVAVIAVARELAGFFWAALRG